MRKAAAAVLLSFACAAEQAEDFVTDSDDATEANPRGVPR
jgi:hypothetical protein